MAVAIDKISTMTLPNYSGLGVAIEGLTAKQAALVLSTRNLSQAELEEVVIQNDLISKYGAEQLVKTGLLSANSSLLVSEKTISAEKLKESIIQSALNKEKATEFVQTQLSIVSDGEETASTIILNKALMNEAVQRGILTKEKAAEILSTYGVVAADSMEIGSKKGLIATTLGLIKSKIALSALESAAVVGISALVFTIYKCNKAVKEARERAQELGDSFKETSSTIDDYKSKIEELYKVINDESSSIEDTTNARKSLLSIQDELIDKFGTEESVINNVTDAINGQTEALDKLSKSKWQETKNDFTHGGFWNDVANFFQDTDNIERMLDEYGEKTISIKWADYADINKLTDEMVTELENIGIDIKVSTDNLQAVRDFDSLTESIEDTKGASLSLSGNAEEIYNKLLALQNLIGNDDSFDKLYDKVGNTAASYKELTDKYKNFYDQYVLQEKIFSDDSKYADAFKNITDTAEKYNEAFTSGDEVKIKEAADEYANLVSTAMATAIANGDSDVATYFENMYPALKSIVNGWNFNIAFDANTDDLQDKVQNVLDELKDENGHSLTAEEILGLGESNAQYQALVAIAHTYNMTIEEMIELLKKRNMVSAMDYQGLVGLFGQDNVDKLSPEDLEIAYKIENVGNMTFEQLQAEIEKTKQQSNEPEISITPTLSSSVEQIARQLEPQFAKLGEAYKEIFIADGFTLDEVDNSMLEDLHKSFAEIEEEIGVTFDASVLNPFFDTLTNKSSTVEQVQDAFNNLATAYFYSTETLEHLTSETADAIEKQLEEMGVQNATEVVADALTAKTEELIVAKEYLAQTGKELTTATEDEQTAFILEQIEAGNCGEALALLQLKKLLVNSAQINTSADIQQIMNLASASGMGAEVLTRLANAKNILGIVEAGGTVSLSSYQKALSDVESAKQTMLDWKPVELDFSNFGDGASKAGNAGKSAAESYIDAFEEELSDLSQLRDNGVITEKEYLDSLRALYERYFANKLGYEKEYAKYQRQYLEGYKSLYESALSGISTLLGNQIDGYKDAKDAAVSSLTQEKDARLEVIDAQKEQLEAQKDLIDEQIEAQQKLIDDIQNEIDAMKEANSERQRQLDLQKAQYELERMQHQRTILQYSEENGMQYVQSDEGLRTAKENVDNAKFEIEISNKEKNISLLEDEISLLEEQKDAIQNQMDLLDKQADQIESYYSKMISETEAYYDSLINNMERQKSKWEEIAEIENIARAYSDLEQVAGGMGYSVQDILSGNEQAFEDFKSRYIALLSDLNNNSSFSEGLSYATSGIAQDIDNLEASAATVSESTGKIAANIGEVNTSAETLSGSLSNIGDALSGFSETDNITAAADAFSKLGQAIQSVADALNISEDGTIGSLTGALKSLCEIPLCQTDDDKNGGILSEFQALKTAVTDVTSAISGGGSSASDSGDGGNSSSPGTSSGAAGNSSGGLAGAIASLKSAATDALGGNGNDESEGQSEGSGIIAQFGQLKNAVTDTTEAIGSGDSKQKKKSKGNSKNGNLISSITSLGSTTSEILTGDGNDEDKSGGVIGRFEQFKDVIGEANEHVTGIATGLHDIDGETVECTIKVNVEQNGELPAYSKGVLAPMKLESGEYKAKYGRAFAKGSGNYKGLPKSEKNALRSEYGQPELTVYPDGTTELTTQPTISDLPKGTVIFNEAQTKEIFQNKADTMGSVSASGSTGQSIPGKPTLPPPQRPAFLVQQELQEECLAKTGNITDKILSPLNMLSRNWKDMAGLTGNINHINHNGQNQSVNVGGINITCPGVTSQEVARQLGTELNHIFSGFHNYADQQSRVR